jgi:hypothetical protein
MTHYQSMRRLIQIVENVTTNDEHDIRVMRGLPDHETQKCLRALRSVQEMLVAEGLADLLLGPIRIVATPERRSRYDPPSDTLYIEALAHDETDTVKSILHEIGHRLNFRMSFWPRMKVWWRHFAAETGWHPTAYSTNSHWEMWAELFRYYMAGWLNAEQERWVGAMIDEAAKAGRLKPRRGAEMRG